MQELWPDPNLELNIAERLAGDQRPKPQGRPWVTMVMIASIDGGINIDGVSGGLGAASDAERFLAARHQADAIIVGAGTVIAENYQPTKSPIAVVTGSLSPDPTIRLFSDPQRQPLLYTTAEAARTRGQQFDGIATVIDLGDSIEPADVLADLDDRGHVKVVLEGGPTLNSLFLRADLVDELLVSYSPLIVGGEGSRMVRGPQVPDERRFTVDRVSMADDLIFVRYLRA